MNFFLLAFGYRRIYANAQNALALLNLCMEKGYVYAAFESDEEGGIAFITSIFTARRLLRQCSVHGICVAEVGGGGIPHFIWRYRRRMGMLLGLLISAFLLLFSSRFVWDVRVTGNETVTEEEVCKALRECGFGVGSYIPDFHGNELENRVLIASDRIAWISIYMDGTVAVVQIKENLMPPTKEPATPANLVAACDGQIELLELYRGNSVVSIGQAVRKGELLVSGLYDSNTVGYRYTRAAGRVLARVEDTFRIEIPLTYEEKVYEEAKTGEVSLDFFNFSVKIFKSSGNSELSCDIIEEKKGLDFLGLRDVPIGLTVSTHKPYRTVTATRTEEEALALAYAQLDEALALHASTAEILQKSISTTMTDTALILDCSVRCIRDIAVQVEFEVLP